MNMIALYPTAKGLTLSDQLVQPTLDDLKRMTRRMMKPCRDSETGCHMAPCELAGEVNAGNYRKSPWQLGDFLYVRETHYRYGHWEQTGKKTRTGKDKWAFVADSDRVEFTRPAGTYRKSRDRTLPGVSQWHKRLARFMPKSCARTVLEVVSVRAERLGDISEDDAIAEGIECWNSPTGGDDYQDYWRDYMHSGNYDDGWPWFGGDPIASFRSLWESINGSGSWERDKGKWVWVVVFKRVAS